MTKLNTTYNRSHALIVGINEYAKAAPLQYAVCDATAVAESLKTNFGFLDENIQVLTDSDATRDAIMQHFLGFGAQQRFGRQATLAQHDFGCPHGFAQHR